MSRKSSSASSRRSSAERMALVHIDDIVVTKQTQVVAQVKMEAYAASLAMYDDPKRALEAVKKTHLSTTCCLCDVNLNIFSGRHTCRSCFAEICNRCSVVSDFPVEHDGKAIEGAGAPWFCKTCKDSELGIVATPPVTAVPAARRSSTASSHRSSAERMAPIEIDGISYTDQTVAVVTLKEEEFRAALAKYDDPKRAIEAVKRSHHSSTCCLCDVEFKIFVKRHTCRYCFAEICHGCSFLSDFPLQHDGKEIEGAGAPWLCKICKDSELGIVATPPVTPAPEAPQAPPATERILPEVMPVVIPVTPLWTPPVMTTSLLSLLYMMFAMLVPAVCTMVVPVAAALFPVLFGMLAYGPPKSRKSTIIQSMFGAAGVGLGSAFVFGSFVINTFEMTWGGA